MFSFFRYISDKYLNYCFVESFGCEVEHVYTFIVAIIKIENKKKKN